MSVFNFINENIALTLSDFINSTNIKTDLSFVLKSQYWSKDELIGYQNNRLKNLIEHSYNNVPYYKELFNGNGIKPKDIRSVEDLRHLPILTKENIRNNIKSKKIIAANIPNKKLILGSSSGSTGEPLQYYVTKDSYSMHYACSIRGWYWMGYRLGDKYVKLSQNPRNKILKKIQDKINRTEYLFAQQLTDENFSVIVERINKYKPQIIRGYPDPMLFLANYIKKRKIKIHTPSAITTTGNTLFPEARKLIEEQFGCMVYDAFSCEGGGSVNECENHSCYHTSMEYAMHEVLCNGKEVNFGESGRLIVTDLHNYAVPFLRYDTQDIVTKSKSNCSCGRFLQSYEKINGRDSDILITPNGKFLILHNFTGYFEWSDSVDHFQVRQESPTDFILFLKVNDKYNKNIEKEIYSYWMEYIKEDINFIIKVVDEIPLSKSGKRRFLIRDDKIKLNI